MPSMDDFQRPTGSTDLYVPWTNFRGFYATFGRYAIGLRDEFTASRDTPPGYDGFWTARIGGHPVRRYGGASCSGTRRTARTRVKRHGHMEEFFESRLASSQRHSEPGHALPSGDRRYRRLGSRTHAAPAALGPIDI